MKTPKGEVYMSIHLEDEKAAHQVQRQGSGFAAFTREPIISAHLEDVKNAVQHQAGEIVTIGKLHKSSGQSSPLGNGW